MTRPEPASVTASRQLAEDARDRRRHVPPGPSEVRHVARRARGATAGPASIRPLGRPVAEHLDAIGSADDLPAAGWRLGRAAPAGHVAREEPLDG